MDKVDWSKAPEWATHALTSDINWEYDDDMKGDIRWVREYKGEYLDDFNCSFIISDKAWRVLEARPTGYEAVDALTDYVDKIPDDPFIDKRPFNKYMREIKPEIFVDIYDVLKAWDVKDPCLQHLIKKALQAGKRGHKGTKEDLEDIIASSKRALEMYKEWEDSQEFGELS